MNGRKLINLLKQNRINTEGIFTIQNRPTIIKTRIIAAQQQIMRIDQENRNNLENKWNQRIFDFINTQIYNVDAILISDYDKGLITDKLIETVVSMARNNNKPIIVDPKVDHFLIYRDITVITPNLKEASVATGINFINEANIVNMGQWLLTQLRCDAVLITRGKDGMSLFEKNGNITHIPTVARAVFDVTGAGDTVTAVVTLCLATGAGMIESAIIANVAAGLVVEKLGIATVTQEELKKRINILKDRNDFFKNKRS
jgi:D-beta-D-heptose 7-phosphate kinase/D-beta-D-heptose 1-phosphate adenosyltransferase